MQKHRQFSTFKNSVSLIQKICKNLILFKNIIIWFFSARSGKELILYQPLNFISGPSKEDEMEEKSPEKLFNDINQRICELNQSEAEYYEKGFVDLNDPLATEMLEPSEDIQIVSFPEEQDDAANSSDGSSGSGFDSSGSRKSARAILAASRTTLGCSSRTSRTSTPLSNVVLSDFETLNRSSNAPLNIKNEQDVEMEIE